MKSLIGGILNRSPVPFTGRNNFSILQPVRSSPEAQMRALGSVGTLFAIVSRICDAVSQVEWKLYRKSLTGNKEDRVEVTRHLALDIWNKPNPYYTREEFVESFTQHLDLTGEAWWVVGRNPNASFPLELWPVRPDRMSPIPSRTDFLSGYMYSGPDGEEIPLGRDEVVMLRMPNPLDPYRGMGPVQSILTDLDSSRYSAEWNRNFFKNSAEPGGIIQVDKKLTDSEFDEMVARWREQHQGVAQSHRVAILEQGMWVDRKYSMRDMQFAEIRSVAREIIREAFGMPKAMLGTVDDVNRANAEVGEIMFARWLVVPRCKRIRGALNNDFLPMFGTTGQGLEFDFVNPVPEDREAENNERLSKAQAAKSLVEAGYDPMAVLSAVGLPEMRFVGREIGANEAGPFTS